LFNGLRIHSWLLTAASVLGAALPLAAAAAVAPDAHFDLLELDVDGNTVLDEVAIDEILEPFLGYDKKPEDVDRARAALENAYRAHGFRTVSVSIPKQSVRDGVVILKVTEARIAHLNVAGSNYHSIDAIKDEAPALAEGQVPDFTQVQKNLVALNSQADRKVTPALKAGTTPGTVDIDLVVDDHLPLHGSLELNDRRSQDTTDLRSVATLSYDNLWQAGHSLSMSFQTAPENTEDARVVYGSYLARLDGPLSLLLTGLRSDSNVATVGGANVLGKGSVFGLRGVLQLDASPGWYPSLSFGVDYKRFKNRVALGSGSFETPVEYYPISLAWSAAVRSLSAMTQLDTSLNFASPQLGSDTETIQLNRANARGQMFWLRSSVARTDDWSVAGLETFVRVNGQLTDQPLISNEQMSIGGMESVRGYLESEALGDYGFSGSAELRSPSFAPYLGRAVDELRAFVFVDGGKVDLREVPPGQVAHFSLASTGVGLNLHFLEYVYGAVDWAEPLIDQTATHAYHGRVLFRVWSSF
jgi:hemolysin activation/secretion protein